MYALLIDDIYEKGDCYDCPVAPNYCNSEEECPLYDVEIINSKQMIAKEELFAMKKEVADEVVDSYIADKTVTELGLYMKENGLCRFKKEDNPIHNTIDVTARALVIVPKENE